MIKMGAYHRNCPFSSGGSVVSTEEVGMSISGALAFCVKKFFKELFIMYDNIDKGVCGIAG